MRYKIYKFCFGVVIIMQVMINNFVIDVSFLLSSNLFYAFFLLIDFIANKFFREGDLYLWMASLYGAIPRK